ncbi:MAG: T9SS type A sorting domain-containing protein [Bacteroidota bacterium]
MKHILLLSFSFLLFSLGLSAQGLEFDDGPIVVMDISADDFEGVGYSNLTNTTTDTRSLTWTRNVVEQTDEWWTAVCDKVQCYAPTVSTRDFTLEGNEQGNIDVHAYPNQTEGSAVVEITVTDQNNADVSLTNVYYFNVQPTSSTKEINVQQIKVYPNPSNGLFSIKGAEGLARVDVFSLTGQQVQSFTHGDGQWYDISNLPKGTYLVRLMDEDAQLLTTKLMQKL